MRSISQCSSCDCKKIASGKLETNLCESIAIIPHSKSTTVCIRYDSPPMADIARFSGGPFPVARANYDVYVQKRSMAAVCTENSIRRISLRSPLFDSTDLSSLRKGYYGASIVPVEVLRELAQRLPKVRLWNLYGQTEIAPPSKRGCRRSPATTTSRRSLSSRCSAMAVEVVARRATTPIVRFKSSALVP